MTTFIAASVSLAVAAIAGVATYLNTRIMNQRQESLRRINTQLEELYGPLLSLSSTSQATWRVFRSVFKPELKVDITANLSSKEMDLWIAWMSQVFMPANRNSVEIIASKAHLIVGDSMPDCFLDFAAHVAGFEVVVKQWESGDRSTLTSIIPHPRDPYHDYIRGSFLELKKRQQILLSLTQVK
ncbi:hypothetical protein [Verrucosispora sp. NA02020]|uniref:hypothetical protein n=1 Tax=Verrucosispora sp. NA02020 TaxID=2742132 RepID=UPI001590C3F1|nr:hypothetical protein [Verrucosispora sp. NA02020]QKW14261.1 hypothetical protein HUT12_16725 [Verrucosispora sp. NA02020]